MSDHETPDAGEGLRDAEMDALVRDARSHGRGTHPFCESCVEGIERLAARVQTAEAEIQTLHRSLRARAVERDLAITERDTVHRGMTPIRLRAEAAETAEAERAKWERLALSTSMAFDTQQRRAEAAETELAERNQQLVDAARELGAVRHTLAEQTAAVEALADLGVREQWPPDEWRAGLTALANPTALDVVRACSSPGHTHPASLHALDAERAEAWDEGHRAASTDCTAAVSWGICGADPDNRPADSARNPYRAALDTTGDVWSGLSARVLGDERASAHSLRSVLPRPARRRGWSGDLHPGDVWANWLRGRADALAPDTAGGAE